MKITALIAGCALAASGALLAVGQSSSEAPRGTVAPAKAAAAAAAVPPTTVGVNLLDLVTYHHQRAFANLVAPGRWFTSTGGTWSEMDKSRLSPDGWPTSLLPGEYAPLSLMRPAGEVRNLAITCTYDGKGDFSAGGIARITFQSRNKIQLRLDGGNNPADGLYLQLNRTDPQDPVRNIDCREPSIPKDQLFAPQFLESLKDFGLVRFMDWQRVNNNAGGNWDRMLKPTVAIQLGAEGVALEHMVALANEANIDPWFVMPYNADDTYLRNFARYVHSKLEPGRTVYVELGNEIWNYGFPGAQQALKEGEAAGLAKGNDALLRRYAQKSKHALAIWTEVFRDNSKRLVRVVSTQSVLPQTPDIVLGFEDTARWVDALATAPYINLDLKGKGAADLDWVFQRLGPAVDEAIDFAARNKAIAARHGKRYIAYEAGQHLVTEDIEFAKLIQRDPRMKDVYVRYLNAWKTRIGDVIALYGHVAPIVKFGSWGLLEYGGQPIEEAPKMQAVRQFQAAAN